MHSNDQDIAIIQTVLRGQQSAYAVLVNRYKQYVFSLVLRYIPERELAEELAQDVFVKAYRNLASYRGESKFSTWLYAIVHTTCLSHMRKKGSMITTVEEDKLVALQDALQQESPYGRLEQSSKKAILNKAIEQLPDVDAQILSLFYIGSQSVDEIAEIANMTTTNVKVRLFRARTKLREIIETKYKGELLG